MYYFEVQTLIKDLDDLIIYFHSRFRVLKVIVVTFASYGYCWLLLAHNGICVIANSSRLLKRLEEQFLAWMVGSFQYLIDQSWYPMVYCMQRLIIPLIYCIHNLISCQ